MTFAASTCPICQSSDWERFFPLPGVPVYCCVLWDTQQAARQCPKGDIELAICHSCGMIANAVFDPALVSYDPRYDNSLHFSSRFQSYAEMLARRLIQTYDLKDKTVIELGCGKGDFLELLCQLGEVRGIGFDPTYVGNGDASSAARNMFVVRDVFSEKYSHLDCSLVCCRHTLEHISHPVTFLQTVRRAIGQRKTPLFFEVPNAWYMLREGSVWDVIYEHCSYFSAPSLARLFRQCRMTVDEVREDYGDQFLCLHATTANGSAVESGSEQEAVLRIVNAAANFGKAYREKVSVWKERLQLYQHQGKRAVIWGAGAKGVTFLNAVGDSGIEYAVDLNPRKHSRFIPGTSQQVVSPAFLREYRPEVVLVMNPMYREEITNHTLSLGFAPEVLTV